MINQYYVIIINVKYLKFISCGQNMRLIDTRSARRTADNTQRKEKRE